MIDAVIFDFDGVILDSNAIKDRAFATLYAPYGKEVVDYVVRYHQYHGGVSRFEKIAHYHDHLLREKLLPEAIDELADIFSAHVYDALCDCPFMPGAHEFISSHAHKVPMMVASGSPDNELKAICCHRSIDQFFEDIAGSPTKKVDIVRRQIKQFNLDPRRTLLVGDSLTDLEAAEANDVLFVAFISGPDSNLHAAKHQVSDLREVTQYI